MKHVVCGAILATALAGGAHAATLPDSFIDFEVLPDTVTTPTEGNLTGALNPLRYEFPSGIGTNAVTFSSPGGTGAPGALGMAEVGGPLFGFFSNDGDEFADTPLDPTAFGRFFLTTELRKVSVLEIIYDTAIGALNFDLGDVDGLQSGDQTRIEVFTVDFKDAGGNIIGSKTVRGDQEFEGQATGDRSVVNVSFSSASDNIKSVFITGTTLGGERNIGIAFDNFDPDEATDPSVIPVPPTLPLIAAGLGALALLRRRKTSA